MVRLVDILSQMPSFENGNDKAKLNFWTTMASSSDNKFVQIWVKTTTDIPLFYKPLNSVKTNDDSSQLLLSSHVLVLLIAQYHCNMIGKSKKVIP